MDVTQEILDIEDWDSYKGQDLEDEKPFDTPPVTDIKNGFESALSGEMHFNGEFAHSTVYEDAPNPCLVLEGLGPIGLPLNELQAEMIMRASTKGTGVEKDIWNFPGNLIRFNNPQWQTWIKNTVVASIHKALDASVAGLSHDVRLKSLSIRAPHAEKKSCINECGEDSKYASLTIVLPSSHVGGNMQHAYQGKTKTFHTSGHSSFATVAIGAYSGTTQALESVDTGYVVSLNYELHCFGNPNIIPRLPHLEVAQNQLQLVFRCWRHALDNAPGDRDDARGDDKERPPSLLLCQLDKTYNTRNFKAMSLEGADRLMLTQMAPLAKLYGFDLHLGQATYYESGSADTGYDDYFGYGGCAYGRRGARGRWGRGYYYDEDDEPEVDADDLDMDSVDSRNLSIEQVVALDGMPMIMVSHAIIEDACDDVDSIFINGGIKDGNMNAEFERYDRSSGLLIHTWKSQVIIISAAKSPDVTFTIGDIRAFASQALSSSLSGQPTKKEKVLVESLIDQLTKRAQRPNEPHYNSSDILRPLTTCLRDCADRWNDVGLFRRVLTGCGHGRAIEIIGVEGLVSAYQAFDWSQISDLYAEAISKGTSNDVRGKMVDQLLSAATEAGDTAVVSWCHAQRESVLDTLQTLKVAEIDWALNLIFSKQDATTYLRDKFLEQLHTVQPSDMEVWSAALTKLMDMSSNTTTTASSFDKTQLKEIIGRCLQRISTTMTPYPPVENTASTGYLYLYSTTRDEAKPLYEFIQLCARWGSLDACNSLFERMWDQNTRKQHDSANPSAPASSYYSGLVLKVDSFIKTNPQHRAAFSLFFDHAVAVLLPKYSTSAASSSIKLALQNIADPLGVLQQRLTAEVITSMSRDALEELGKWISSAFRALSTTSEASKKLTVVLTKCMGGLLTLLRKHLHAPTTTSYSYSYSSTHGNGLQVIRFAIQIGLTNHTSLVLDEYLKSPKANDDTYITSTLVPFLEGMSSTLAQHKLTMNATLVAEVIRKYTRLVLGQKPVDHSIPVQELRAIGCGCVLCTTYLIPFFLSERTRTDISLKQKDRSHLENRILKTRAWGVTWQTIRAGSPHTLRIEKPQKMVAVSTWAGKQTKANQLVQLLGNAVAQRQALGSDYTWVIGTIAGTERPPPLQAKTNTVANVPTAGVSTLKRAADPSSSAAIPPAKVPRLG